MKKRKTICSRWTNERILAHNRALYSDSLHVDYKKQTSNASFVTAGKYPSLIIDKNTENIFFTL